MFKERYLKQKEIILNDKSINSNNRKYIKQFLELKEKKLKRKEGLADFDERSSKTLYGFIGTIRKINEWWSKDWGKLTKDNISKLIDDLEDGIIKNKEGKKYGDRSKFYQMIQGKIFYFAGVGTMITEVFNLDEIKGRNDGDKQVRFIAEETFKQMPEIAISLEQKTLLWLAFDIGENIGSLLELKKEDFRKQINETTKEGEYLVILSRDNLKRSRTARSEITNYKETTMFLDMVLSNLKPSDRVISNKYMKDKALNELHEESKLFKFGLKSAERFLKRIVDKLNIRCEPGGEKLSWKDLRSSMACDLLKKGWSRDEVNARLGHKPSSRIIDRYINFLALDRHEPKKKIYENNLAKLQEELDKSKEFNKLQGLRMEELNNKFSKQQDKMIDMVEVIAQIKEMTNQGMINEERKERGLKPLMYKKIKIKRTSDNLKLLN